MSQTLLLRATSRARATAAHLREDSLARNSAAIAAASAVTSVFGYAYWVAAARLFPTESVGAVTAAVSAMALVSTVAILGGQSLLVERLPHRTTPREWSATVTSITLLTAAASLAGALLTLVALPLIGIDVLTSDPLLAVSFVVAVVATTASTLTDFAWIAERRAWVMLATNALFAFGKLVVLFGLAGVTDSPTGLMLSWTGTCVLAMVISFGLLAKWRGLRPVLTGWREEVRQVKASLAGHHLINLSVVAPTLAMPVLAGARLSLEDSAYLYAAWRVGGVFVLLASATASALFAEGSHDPSGYLRRARRTAPLLVGGLLVGVVVMIAVRGPVLGIFGDDYRAAASTALLLLILAALPEAVVALAGAVFRVQGRLALAAWITGTIAVGQIAAAWVLMPSYGITAAALCALLAQCVGVVAVLVAVLVLRRRRTGGPAAPGSTTSPANGPSTGPTTDTSTADSPTGGTMDSRLDVAEVPALRVWVPAPRRDLDPSGPTVTVVVPAMNEAKNLPWLAERMPDGVAEIILVDGRSTDDTVEVARSLWPDVRVVTQTRRGKGNAMACGFAAATAEITVMIDADGSMDPGEIPYFVDALTRGADYAKGSRFCRGGGSNDITRFRRLGNLFLNTLTNAWHGTRYSDLCYGYNAFWTRVGPLLNLDAGTPGETSDEKLWGDGFEIETLINVRVHTAGLRISEVASYETTRLHGASNLNAVSDGLRVLRTIMKERRLAGMAPLDLIPQQAHTHYGPPQPGPVAAALGEASEEHVIDLTALETAVAHASHGELEVHGVVHDGDAAFDVDAAARVDERTGA